MGKRSQSLASKYGEMSRSKKGKRKAAPRPPVFTSSAPAANGGTDSSAVATSAPKIHGAPSRYMRRGQQSAEALITDYSYIAKDLRQIAITAVAMFVLMGVLFVILR